jgi:hypothetical protein
LSVAWAAHQRGHVHRHIALAAAIWHNWTIGATSKRSLTTLDH